MLVPSTGASVAGSFYLDASGSSAVGIASVDFEVTGGFLIDEVVSGSTATLYGWIGEWNTKSFPNGTYALQSVATDVNGVSTTSAPITLTLDNPTSPTTPLGNGSVDEAWLTGARPGDHVALLQNGSLVPNPANPGTADSLGSLIVRDLVPGPGYSSAGDAQPVRRPPRSPSWHPV